MQEGTLMGYDATIRPGFPFVAISGGAITSVIFVYFFFFSFYLVATRLTKLDWINVVLGVFYIFFTSRRVLFINFLLSFVFVFLLILIMNRKVKIELFKTFKCKAYFMFCFLAIIVVVSLLFDFVDFLEIGEFVDSAVGDNSDPRVVQFKSLMFGWSEKPIFGNGTGVNAGVVRSNIPGVYELSYVAMLFERGIIGTLVFVLQYLILMYWSIQSLKKGKIDCKYILSLIIAVNLFMIANATNPYLGAFDHIWFLFLPFVIIRLSENSKNENMCLGESL